MQFRCRKKPLLYSLLATAILSVSICLVALTLLSREEEGDRLLEPGLRPVIKYGHGGEREILNVGDEGRRQKRQEPNRSHEIGEG